MAPVQERRWIDIVADYYERLHGPLPDPDIVKTQGVYLLPRPDTPPFPSGINPDPNELRNRIDTLELQQNWRYNRYGAQDAEESRIGHTPLELKQRYWDRQIEAQARLDAYVPSDTESESDDIPSPPDRPNHSIAVHTPQSITPKKQFLILKSENTPDVQYTPPSSPDEQFMGIPIVKWGQDNVDPYQTYWFGDPKKYKTQESPTPELHKPPSVNAAPNSAFTHESSNKKSRSSKFRGKRRLSKTDTITDEEVPDHSLKAEDRNVSDKSSMKLNSVPSPKRRLSDVDTETEQMISSPTSKRRRSKVNIRAERASSEPCPTILYFDSEARTNPKASESRLKRRHSDVDTETDLFNPTTPSKRRCSGLDGLPEFADPEPCPEGRQPEVDTEEVSGKENSTQKDDIEKNSPEKGSEKESIKKISTEKNSIKNNTTKDSTENDSIEKNSIRNNTEKGRIETDRIETDKIEKDSTEKANDAIRSYPSDSSDQGPTSRRPRCFKDVFTSCFTGKSKSRRFKKGTSESRKSTRSDSLSTKSPPGQKAQSPKSKLRQSTGAEASKVQKKKRRPTSRVRKVSPV